MKKDLKDKVRKLLEEKSDMLIKKKIIRNEKDLYDDDYLTIGKMVQISEELNICIYELVCYYSQVSNFEYCNSKDCKDLCCGIVHTEKDAIN